MEGSWSPKVRATELLLTGPLAVQAQSEEERAGLQAQLELTNQDMERAQQRLLALEAAPASRPAPVRPAAVLTLSLLCCAVLC